MHCSSIRRSIFAAVPLTAYLFVQSATAQDAATDLSAQILTAQDLTGSTVIAPSKPKASAV